MVATLEDPGVGEALIGAEAAISVFSSDRRLLAVNVAPPSSAGEADILRKNGEPLAVEYVVIPTRVRGERQFIELMWPLVVQEPRRGRATAQAVAREAG